ncbi:hypothetical protein GCM10020255_076910 [Rhodococcus baikonurensis]
MGTVVVQAPEHEVENLRAVAKAGDDPKKIKKIQRKKAPEGFVSWSEATFDRLVAASPEPLVSRFSVSNSMLLNVIARPGNCFDAMRHLLEDNHESRRRSASTSSKRSRCIADCSAPASWSASTNLTSTAGWHG